MILWQLNDIENLVWIEDLQFVGIVFVFLFLLKSWQLAWVKLTWRISKHTYEVMKYFK